MAGSDPNGRTHRTCVYRNPRAYHKRADTNVSCADRKISPPDSISPDTCDADTRVVSYNPNRTALHPAEHRPRVYPHRLWQRLSVQRLHRHCFRHCYCHCYHLSMWPQRLTSRLSRLLRRVQQQTRQLRVGVGTVQLVLQVDCTAAGDERADIPIDTSRN